MSRVGINSGRINIKLCDISISAVPKIQPGPRRREAEVLSNLTIPCVVSGVPSPAITWTGPDGQVINSVGRFTISETGELFIMGTKRMLKLWNLFSSLLEKQIER